MRIFKIVLWVVLIALFGLVVYQDQSFFLKRYELGFHIGSRVYKFKELPLAVLFASFFFMGWLIAYFFGLLERYRVGRANKQLRNDAASMQNSLNGLKKEVEILRSGMSGSTAGTSYTPSPSSAAMEETA